MMKLFITDNKRNNYSSYLYIENMQDLRKLFLVYKNMLLLSFYKFIEKNYPYIICNKIRSLLFVSWKRVITWNFDIFFIQTKARHEFIYELIFPYK